MARLTLSYPVEVVIILRTSIPLTLLYLVDLEFWNFFLMLIFVVILKNETGIPVFISFINLFKLPHIIESILYL